MPKLRFLEFDGEWEEKKLSDISKLTSSKRVYLVDYTKNGIPFYRGKEISALKNGKSVDDLLYISEEKYTEFKNKFGVPKENDILITGVGTLGNVYRIPNNEPFYFKDGNLIWLRDINENSHFLEYVLDFNKNKILSSAIGSTQKALTIVELNKLKFQVPYPLEQEKIASFLSKVDEKIEKLEKKQELWETYKKEMMQQIFSQKLRFKDENDEDYPDWEIKRLGEISKKVKEKNKDSLIKNVFSNSALNGLVLQKNFFDKDIANKNNLSGYYIVKNDFFVYNPRISKFAPVGPINVNKTGISGLVSPLYTVFAADDEIIPYLEYYFSNTEWHAYVRSVANYGARYDRMNITDKDFFEMPIKLPSPPEQSRIISFLSDIKTKLEYVEIELEVNKKFKKGLLQQMFC